MYRQHRIRPARSGPPRKHGMHGVLEGYLFRVPCFRGGWLPSRGTPV